MLKDNGMRAIAGARYMILLMGFFATFCGICYNDFMAIPIEWGSCYEIIPPPPPTKEDPNPKSIAELIPDCVHNIGVDPVWYTSENMLNFINPMKMKISVIFGVTQMCLGITMKAFNALYFKKTLDFYFEFIP